MAKPLVAIVGRPNVGKSTFFNKIAGRRISIVEDIPGVTRDRVYADVEWMGRRFSMVDTGGLDMRSEDVLLSQMRRQAEIAIETCDVILFFVDGRQGLTADDEMVADLLRRSRKLPIAGIASVQRERTENLAEEGERIAEFGLYHLADLEQSGKIRPLAVVPRSPDIGLDRRDGLIYRARKMSVLHGVQHADKRGDPRRGNRKLLRKPASDIPRPEKCGECHVLSGFGEREDRREQPAER